MESQQVLTLCKSRPKNNSNVGVIPISQTPGLEPHHQMQFSVMRRLTIKSTDF